MNKFVILISGFLLAPFFLVSCKGKEKKTGETRSEISNYQTLTLNLQKALENNIDFTYEVYFNVTCQNNQKTLELKEQVIKSSDVEKKINYISTDNFSCNISIVKIKINDKFYEAKNKDYLNISTVSSKSATDFVKYFSENGDIFIHGNKEHGILNLFLTDLEIDNFKRDSSGLLVINEETKEPIINSSFENKNDVFDKDYAFTLQYHKAPKRLPFKLEIIYHKITDKNNKELSNIIISRLNLENYDTNKTESSFANCYIVSYDLDIANLTPTIAKNIYHKAKTEYGSYDQIKKKNTNEVIACTDFEFNKDDNWESRKNKIHYIIYTSKEDDNTSFRVFAINKIQ